MGRLPLDSLGLLISVVEGGRSYKEVASDLGVARSTVERRIKGLLRRLQQAGALGSIRVDWLDSLVAIRRERETIMWARATGSMDGPLIERLEALAHREPAQIANAILAGDEEIGPTTEPAPDETAPPSPSGDGRVAEALREAEAMELF